MTDVRTAPYAAEEKRGYRTAKRVFDILLSFPLGILSLIPMGILAAVIVCKDGENPFYGQSRVGQNGQEFRLIKLRSMKKGADRLGDVLDERQLQEYQMREAFEGMRADFARDVTAVYGADFESEMQNPDFARLMGAGVPVKTAYEVIHQQEIAQARAQAATNQARENVMKTIQAQGARPEEIGSGAGGGTTVPMKTKWTRAEVEDMRRRAAMGERVIP